jgi:hypothetical protein
MYLQTTLRFTHELLRKAPFRWLHSTTTARERIFLRQSPLTGAVGVVSRASIFGASCSSIQMVRAHIAQRRFKDRLTQLFPHLFSRSNYDRLFVPGSPHAASLDYARFLHGAHRPPAALRRRLAAAVRNERHARLWRGRPRRARLCGCERRGLGACACMTGSCAIATGTFFALREQLIRVCANPVHIPLGGPETRRRCVTRNTDELTGEASCSRALRRREVREGRPGSKRGCEVEILQRIAQRVW